MIIIGIILRFNLLRVYHIPDIVQKVFFFKFIYFYFLAALGLCCGTWDLRCGVWVFSLLLRHASSVVVVRGLSCPTACGILVP